MKKTYLGSSILLSSILLLGGCSETKTVQPSTVNIAQRCNAPLINYRFNSITQGDFNTLGIKSDFVQRQLLRGLQESNCFFQPNSLIYGEYELKIVYGTSNSYQKESHFIKTTTQDDHVIEVQISFSNFRETRVYTGKAKASLYHKSYFGVKDSETIFTQAEIDQTTIDAINAAINAAIEDFKKRSL